MDNGAQKTEMDHVVNLTSSTTRRTCSSTWRMPRIELNGEEPVRLTPHLRVPQPEGERERVLGEHIYADVSLSCI